jgi:glycosyltransferase involved in cell wall biosynthesis
MTFSVLIAAYRADRFLPQALASVAAQTHRDWELVVVEDGSRDATEAIVSAFAAAAAPRPVRYANLGENRGVAAARNRLLELAAGEAVAFLDADDRWRPDHLAGLAAALAAGPALAVSALERWDGDGDRTLGVHRPTPAQLRAPYRALFARSFIETSSCVALPRATLARVGRFDETLRIGEDRDYWLRALAAGGALGFSPAPTCRYTKHAGSSMTRTRRVAEDAVRFYEKHLRAPGIPRTVARRALAAALRTLGRLARRENPAAARAAFLRGWRVWPAALDLPLRALAAHA